MSTFVELKQGQMFKDSWGAIKIKVGYDEYNLLMDKFGNVNLPREKFAKLDGKKDIRLSDCGYVYPIRIYGRWPEVDRVVTDQLVGRAT